MVCFCAHMVHVRQWQCCVGSHFKGTWHYPIIQP